jgi:glycosyltransferase involved in cell wall biosynthesis
LAGYVHLVGQREDMPSFLAGLNLLCVPSLYGEGFPNVLGEAMACGVPCVATDVGESRTIVADTGRIVPPGDPASLGDAMGELLALDPEDRSDLGRSCRGRIQENYSLEKIAERYTELYLAVAG